MPVIAAESEIITRAREKLKHEMEVQKQSVTEEALLEKIALIQSRLSPDVQVQEESKVDAKNIYPLSHSDDPDKLLKDIKKQSKQLFLPES